MTLLTQISLADGVTEHAVSIPSANGPLSGNLIECGTKSDHAVLFIHGFGGVRSGPHNLLTHMARALADANIPSLRFDLSGRGESPGSAVEVTLEGMAEDALSAAELLKSMTHTPKLTLVGICSGGNVGIGILDRLPECDSLFLLSVYPFGDADSFRREARRSAAVLREYWRKLWVKDSWMKLVRGEIQFSIIAERLFKPFTKRKKTTDDVAPEEKDSNTRHPLMNLLINRPKLTMVYGDADPEFGISNDYYRAFAEENDFPIERRTVSGANHNFYSIEWKKQLTNDLLRFIKEI